MDRFTPGEMDKLIEKYFDKDGYEFTAGFAHRYDQYSSKVCYSLIRLLKPTKVVEFGTSRGGATSFIQAALLKNKKPFKFVAGEKESGLLNETMVNVMKKNGSTPVFVGDIQEGIGMVPKTLDFAFIDSNHDFELTEWYFENILSRLRPGAILALHDWDIFEQPDGTYVTKSHNQIPTFPETHLIFELFKRDMWPFKKLYWTNDNEQYKGTESSFWEYTGK